jgi:hypothetical protein
MSKRRLKVDTTQLSLLDLIKQAQELDETPSTQGSLNIEAQVRQELSDAIKTCPLSLHQIAGEMSHLLGETITAEMIYSWTAESKSKHQIWGTRLGVFCRVTGKRRALEIVNETAGVFCLPGPEALRAEIQHLREQELKVGRERRRREIFLREIEGDTK